MRAGPQVASLAGVDVFTMPPGVAADYRAHPVDELSSQANVNPQVVLAQGVRLQDFNGSSLWDVPQPLVRCVEGLLRRGPDALTPDALQAHFEAGGLGDFLPRWSDAELQAIRSDGKIPSFQRWRDRLASGEVGLDALMNVSGLLSFAGDQQALDDRVRSLL
jgi:hypothetical protein